MADQAVLSTAATNRFPGKVAIVTGGASGERLVNLSNVELSCTLCISMQGLDML